MNFADADVYRFLRYFTFLPLTVIEKIEQNDQSSESKPQAQRILAEQMTRLVHDERSLEQARRISEALFSGSVDTLTREEFQQFEQDGLPTCGVTETMTRTDLLVSSGGRPPVVRHGILSHLAQSN
ncbi:hypothetical protein JW498_14355 [Amphritea sp. RP18W]|uniref:Uncharacterized protein n=1 Tax=Amphritea pacifica TaxID=2811233 RepID=A0ABS2WA00_9GAMM|nr:hypothetical protein [Amphritea pacifica]